MTLVLWYRQFSSQYYFRVAIHDRRRFIRLARGLISLPDWCLSEERRSGFCSVTKACLGCTSKGAMSDLMKVTDTKYECRCHLREWIPLDSIMLSLSLCWNWNAKLFKISLSRFYADMSVGNQSGLLMSVTCLCGVQIYYCTIRTLM